MEVCCSLPNDVDTYPFPFARKGDDESIGSFAAGGEVLGIPNEAVTRQITLPCSLVYKWDSASHEENVSQQTVLLSGVKFEQEDSASNGILCELDEDGSKTCITMDLTGHFMFNPEKYWKKLYETVRAKNGGNTALVTYSATSNKISGHFKVCRNFEADRHSPSFSSPIVRLFPFLCKRSLLGVTKRNGTQVWLDPHGVFSTRSPMLMLRLLLEWT